MTPEASGCCWRVLSDSSRRVTSQSQRSASVRGWPSAIFWTLDGVWNCDDPQLLVVFGKNCCSDKLTVSPSRYGKDNVECRCSATEVFPQPAGPVMTQMCLC